jgi:DNA topoisomerase-1
MTLDEWHRIGNASSYAKRNQTYGLTTLRRKHVDIENDELNFSLQRKKKGVQREAEIHDDELDKTYQKKRGTTRL